MTSFTGNQGSDRLMGGAGNDSFIFKAFSEIGDTVADFSSAATG